MILHKPQCLVVASLYHQLALALLVPRFSFGLPPCRSHSTERIASEEPSRTKIQNAGTGAPLLSAAAVSRHIFHRGSISVRQTGILAPSYEICLVYMGTELYNVSGVGLMYPMFCWRVFKTRQAHQFSASAFLAKTAPI